MSLEETNKDGIASLEYRCNIGTCSGLVVEQIQEQLAGRGDADG
jgi:hypothetical protein